MYLKSLDMVGFKSFADKTHLHFEPGMTAIVGPNGCGKSNVADALRWVLGEQSAKALRGSKMEDCIFNGTDKRKPLGMAEVNVTFADCESALGTEYHEVTITRRVFRSGEGQYFINKTPCRLKDINRLFLGTGVGTSSYSMLEQGRIDAILSARPEDRRTVFEEASGITKFKQDKKEAIQKLDHTEANLLRLSDVIREVKRQIGSLQRQAGKARRYKTLRDELRQLDIFVTRQRLDEAAGEITKLDKQMASFGEQQQALQAQVREAEATNAELREAVVAAERQIGHAMESSVQARGRLDHTREMIALNQQRIAEYKALSERDTREVDTTREQITRQQAVMEEHTSRMTAVTAEREAADAELAAATQTLEAHRAQVAQLREQIQEMRQQSVGIESTVSHLQNQLVELESQQRAHIIQRERLAAEKTELTSSVAAYAEREAAMQGEIEKLGKEVDYAVKRGEELRLQRQTTRETAETQRQRIGKLQADLAAERARLDVIGEGEESGEGYCPGTRMLLDDTNPLGISPQQVLGAVAAQISAEPNYQVALEVALRNWVDAAVVQDAAAAREMLTTIASRKCGTTRVLAPVAETVPTPDGPGEVLLDHVTCEDHVRPILTALIGHVRVVATISDIPDTLPSGTAYATLDGFMAHANGATELWQPDADTATPLTRRHLAGRAHEAITGIESELETLTAALEGTGKTLGELDHSLREAGTARDTCRQAFAQKEGERHIIAREAEEARKRLETVTWELDALSNAGKSGTDEAAAISEEISGLRKQRSSIAELLGNQTEELHRLETAQNDMQASATESRIRAEGLAQRQEHLQTQLEAMRSRLDDLAAAADGRAAGLKTYRESIEKLTTELVAAQESVGTLESEVEQTRTQATALQQEREKQEALLAESGKQLAAKRAELEALHEQRSALDIALTECRMRRQNQMDRITGDYHITVEQLNEEPAPEAADDEATSLDMMDTRVAELRTKLEAMGPVNLVAIEEYQELEERFTFLTAQEEDLQNSKQQLMELIRKINKTTSEMFRNTFDQVNENFQAMFTSMFNGGSAKLVLVNEEEVLECGIEIIARPPGKRLQNVSLLSGGERTLTAVALLFSIYMIKPSPFCVLDELDAALDDTNIGRFVTVLKGFLEQSQFVIITHNRQTIAAANILYGVTMPERGISRIMSMRFNEQADNPEGVEPIEAGEETPDA